MPNKLKIVLTILAVVAIFLVFKLAQYVNAVANQGSTFQQTSPLPAADEDADHDGLNNQQEVIWGSDPFNPDTDGDGFKDGEEVNSGHNPLIPGPDDIIGQDNLTEQFSELTVAGLAEGSLQPDSANYDKALANITGSIVDSGKYLFGKKFNEDELSTIEATAQSNGRFLETVAPKMGRFVDLINDQYSNLGSTLDAIGSNGFSGLKSYYDNQAAKYKNILNESASIKVPQNLKFQHAEFLSLVMQMYEISNAMAQGDVDPIKASFALDAFGEVYPQYFSLLESYRSAFEAIGLDENSIKIQQQ